MRSHERASVAVVAALVCAVAVACSSSESTPQSPEPSTDAGANEASSAEDASDEWAPVDMIFEECTPRSPRCLKGGRYCWYPDGQCGPEGEDGRCVAQATLSFCEDHPDAVLCGCDGKTYRNECEAQAARTNVRSRGPCP